MKITVVDSIMGKGKTSWAIQHMNQTENKFIFITPFLDEVKRIKDSCVQKKFREPINFGEGKQDNFHHLLSNNDNIVSTHALFRMSTDVTRELINCGEYTLILDEVMDVIEQVHLKKDDLPSMIELGLVRLENNLLVWNEDKMDYDGKYNDIKIMCINNSLIMVNNTILMWSFPVNVFNSFKEVYILTYKFYSQIQRYYYDLYDVNYEYKTVEKNENNYYLIDKDLKIKENVQHLKEKINILSNDKINNVGENEYALSSTWFKKDDNEELIKLLKKNITNYFINKMKAKGKDILWTTFKDSKNSLSGKGYSKSFISCNIRATNEYSDRHYLTYCLNVFLNPIVSQFFINNGVKIDEEGYALSEMIQWIWRSAIRNNEEINVYIPSSRMRKLLEEYLN